ncbi:aminotransferase class V-fold PLP-dependent enzyme [Shewanella zhangzhouensis]|uniref:aminotransferase class V-fold PLP-dependent enzyme n=1 Tax=Shewanella zhangzhouensis TaxID=2864213 RepID=UPI001C659E1E|nr:cysteine desulfurase [Shewanella zhangzhouensis]QYK04422.1 cysteine desulfurase [Shewanella zhangzhouensis]
MNIPSLRNQFPALDQHIGDYPLVYLDTAATSQKPRQVLDAMANFLTTDNANVHRAAHTLSGRATASYEAVRDKLKAFIHAVRREEIIFTHGTTEAINLVANGLKHRLNPGDVILVDSAAHHANLVPWQQLAAQTGARVEAIPLTAELRLDIAAFEALLEAGAAVVALGHVSNVLGTVNDVKTLCAKARAKGALTLVDGAQAVAHQAVDVADIGCDFYVFSGHKMYAPDGVGVLYGRFEALDSLTPLLTGGEMIKTVSFADTQFGELPNRLEAGTPPIVSVIGLGAAIDFINSLDRLALQAHERELMARLRAGLETVPQIRIHSPHDDTAYAPNSGAIAFNLGDQHHQDVGILLDQQGIAVRCGHHCAMPLMSLMGVKGCCRASIGLYTTPNDIDRFLAAIKEAAELLCP